MNPLITSLLVFVGVTLFVYIMYGRTAVLLAMKPDNRLDHLGQRIRALILFGLGQKRMVDPEERTPGWAHILIFVAFMVLAVRTVMLFTMGFSSTLLELLSTPTDPFWGDHAAASTVFGLYLLAKDVVAFGALVGVAYFFWLRSTVKPDRLTRSWEAYLILGFIAGLMVSEYTFGASHLVLQQEGFTFWEPFTSLVAMILAPLPKGVVWGLGAAAFWVHLTIILTFLNFLPLGKHF
ncbi:MAG TPA: (Fe-S)-binding protein, partial [Myxococcaceae bacterium]|nr:(Fe-S)-binding protein [Myxococcaceae bacterium]